MALGVLLYLINDPRLEPSFKRITFCGYAKPDVLASVRKSILKRDLVSSLRWIAEAHASGYVSELFDLFEDLFLKEMNIENPKIIPYIHQRRGDVREVLVSMENFLDTRNHYSVRVILAEVCSVLIFSGRNPLPQLRSLKPKDLEEQSMLSQCSFYGVSFLTPELWREDDPVQLKGVYNELFGCLYSKDFERAMYWLAWLQMWEKCGNLLPMSDSPDGVSVSSIRWFGWKIWNWLKQSPDLPPQYIATLEEMAVKPSRTMKAKRQNALILACLFQCRGIQVHRPLRGVGFRVASVEELNEVYREVSENRSMMNMGV
jgi:hypothetical protein